MKDGQEQSKQRRNALQRRILTKRLSIHFSYIHRENDGYKVLLSGERPTQR